MKSITMVKLSDTNGKRLNYIIPEELNKGLEKYCDQTGRSASDVIRQLLSEFIDGDRKLSGPPKNGVEGIRSNMLLPNKLLDQLDKKIEGENLGTRGGVITRLLYDFLENRLGTLFKETIVFDLDRSTYNNLHTAAQKLGIELEDVLVMICKEYVEGK